jgi:hypothetical protein
MQLAANVTSGDAVDWHAIDLKRVYRTVKNLRQRIFRADCLSRVPGDWYARFCGEGVIAISSPYPTRY